MSAKVKETPVSEMANWRSACENELMHQKNWHQNWSFLSKDAGPGDEQEQIDALKAKLAAASEGKPPAGFFTTQSDIGNESTGRAVKEVEDRGTKEIWYGRKGDKNLMPANPY